MTEILVLAVLGVLQRGQMPHEPTGCGSNIVSATVVATFCGHREGNAEMLDMFILWRGRPGWFQRRLTGSTRSGSRGEHSIPFSNKLLGQATQYTTYNDVTIGYAADFDARAVTVESKAFTLDEFNTILVDHVDVPASRGIVARRRVSPTLTLGADYNLEAVRRSRALVDFLQCEVRMPPVQRDPNGRPLTEPPVMTVCQKMASK